MASHPAGRRPHRLDMISAARQLRHDRPDRGAVIGDGRSVPTERRTWRIPMRGMEFDLDQVLNPAAVFNHPRDVLNDPDLSKQEKRAILSSWASDACAVESVPGLRQAPGARVTVSL